MKKRTISIVILVLIAVLMLGGCGGSGSGDGSKQAAEAPSAAAGNSTEKILTVCGYGGKETTYSLADLDNLGMETVKFSGRNKENNNERQVREYTGVGLKKLLEDAGYGKDGEIIKVTCSDGYAREYETDSLYGLCFFDGEKAEKGKNVEPLLAVIREGESIGNDKTYSEKDGSPLRLIYGQAEYDSDYTKDFNMQGWASYVEKIEVKKADE